MADQNVSRDQGTGLTTGKRLLLLLVGALLLVFSNGRWVLPLATWLAPVLVMRYFRSVPKLWQALLFVWLVFFFTNPISWFGLIPFPVPVFARIAASASLLALVPYLLDRITLDRLKGIPQTLVFPCSMVAIGFIGSFQTESTWGNLAYTQADFLPLLQLASVTGIWGISFLIYWLAPVVNNAWEAGSAEARVRKGLWVYASVLALVLLAGMSRLVFFPPKGESLRAAVVIPPDLLDFFNQEEQLFIQQLVMRQDVDPVRRNVIIERLSSTYDQVFSDTRSEARAGAEFVSWPEGSLVSFDKSQDKALIEQARQLAAEESIYLAMTIALIPDDPRELNENRLLIIDPAGNVQQTYWKTYTVPVVEEPFSVSGSGRVAVLDTPYGRFGGVICYDMDVPRFLHEAGEKSVDILIAPSGDWPAIKELHSRMAILRAVEQGFSLVRAANHGLTVAADYQGRILSQMDHYQTSDRRMSAWVPRNGVTTVYSRVGDAFAWICIAAAGVFLLLLVIPRFFRLARKDQARATF